MSVFLVIRIPGGTQEQYDQVEAGLGEPRLGAGQTYHVAGPTDDGWCVVDVWESREHFDRFVAERLAAQLEAAGLGAPEITEIPVHNEVRG